MAREDERATDRAPPRRLTRPTAAGGTGRRSTRAAMATACSGRSARGQIVDWTVVDANALVRRRWAGVVGDVVGVRSSRLNAAADNSALHALYARAIASGGRQVLDLRLNLPAAKGGWRRVVVTPLDGETVSTITRDISHERYLEAALERERLRPVRLPFSRDIPNTGAEARFAARAGPPCSSPPGCSPWPTRSCPGSPCRRRRASWRRAVRDRVRRPGAGAALERHFRPVAN